MATPTPAVAHAPIERTEHPHVVRSVNTLDGEPRVDGTRIPVRQISSLFAAGWSIAEIVDDFPPLTPAQIHDALSYAHDHPDEMAFHEERHERRTIMREQDVVDVAGRLVDRDRLNPAEIPPSVTIYTWETLPREIAE